MPTLTVHFMGLCTFVETAGIWRSVLVDAHDPTALTIDPRLPKLVSHLATLRVPANKVAAISGDLLSFLADGASLERSLMHRTLTVFNPAKKGVTAALTSLPNLSTLAGSTLGLGAAATSVTAAACHFDIDSGTLAVVTPACTWDTQLTVETTDNPVLALTRTDGSLDTAVTFDGDVEIEIGNNPTAMDLLANDHFLFHYLTTDATTYPNPTPTIAYPPGCSGSETPACSNAVLK